MDSEIKIYRSRRKAGILLLFCLLFLVTGIAVLQGSDKVVAGWSCILLSLLGFIVGFYAWFDRRPQIVITRHGVTERTFGGEIVEWDAILNVDDIFYRGQYYIRLMVDSHYKPSLVRSHWLFRIDRYYDRAGVKPLYFKASMLEARVGTITAFIHAMAAADDNGREELFSNAPGLRPGR